MILLCPKHLGHIGTICYKCRFRGPPPDVLNTGSWRWSLGMSVEYTYCTEAQDRLTSELPVSSFRSDSRPEDG